MKTIVEADVDKVDEVGAGDGHGVEVEFDGEVSLGGVELGLGSGHFCCCRLGNKQTTPHEFDNYGIYLFYL